MTAPPDPALTAAALACAGRGWHVFPLTPGAKKPAVRDWEHRATTDPGRIRRCWQAGPFNIGLACGPSRLLVVDLDTPKHPGDTPPEAWALPGVTDGADVLAVLCERAHLPFPDATFTVRTRSGGLHLYFAVPEAVPLPPSTVGTLGWKVDTRCRGGYVLAPGSVVDAVPYRVERNDPPAPLPSSLISKGAPARQTPRITPARWRDRMSDADAYSRAALDGETARVRTAPEGQRNHTLFRAAAALGRLVAAGTLPREAAEGALAEAATAVGLGEAEIRRTLASGLARGAQLTIPGVAA
ncbi:bifunctional DNA primase/polymerase [Streptacidiphilus sp. ASG 303]|uniref:bifunctional DNA primase/polymerase n=1 Tax=Streptacidiphilus sp. ASG 303 TaxID=2896847 RepID=UPI001E442173|nr:bifunctional DNA primase/polymerase [Streptacidiphilus sp. ASG 303]MCD0482794.1 bifunctional DNA primase/polymerase [Streptacidiphilus sp. ASG 303]